MERDELLDEVWGHRHGSDKALTRCISELRSALEDEHDSPIVRTVPKRGYFLGAKVEVLEGASQDRRDPAPANDKPSIAVLPVVDTGRDPNRAHDFIAELSRHSGLLVISIPRIVVLFADGPSATPRR